MSQDTRQGLILQQNHSSLIGSAQGKITYLDFVSQDSLRRQSLVMNFSSPSVLTRSPRPPSLNTLDTLEKTRFRYGPADNPIKRQRAHGLLLLLEFGPHPPVPVPIESKPNP